MILLLLQNGNYDDHILKAFFKEFLQYEFVYFENLGVKLVRYYV